jgi:molybdate transport system substrate-binding protein
MANQLKILSAGAVKPAMDGIVAAFRRDHGNEVAISFATAPATLKRLAEGEAADIVIAASGVLAELAKSGQCAARQALTLGRIGVGVFVRAGESLPRLNDVDDFKRSLLGAESIVYNQASTGIYLDSLFESLGIAAAIRSKSTRYLDFAAVLSHIVKGAGREIGLGATTVLIENESQGVKFAGPLPAEIQNYTVYGAAVLAGSERRATAREFMRYLGSSAAKELLYAAGIR